MTDPEDVIIPGYGLFGSSLRAIAEVGPECSKQSPLPPGYVYDHAYHFPDGTLRGIVSHLPQPLKLGKLDSER